ncbi:MAG: hypothetical protein M1825_000772 [Sarcosagium campestre]|nr:MAG: hypothetical protein M1825_000772 [Sarcosagium campestre]
MKPKVIIVTGASRGIGHAIATHLLQQRPHSHNLVLVARSAPPLLALQTQFPEHVEVVTGDVVVTANSTTAASSGDDIADDDYSLAERAVETAVRRWPDAGIDGLVLNHGTLEPVARVAKSSGKDWGDAFRVNLFSCVEFVKEALPHLRRSKGRIIFTSSGAAQTSYTAWGAYGASKAALNHLAQTLGREEPDVVSVAVRPGVVDTDMQQQVRDNASKMTAAESDKFAKLHAEGKLLRPEQPGHVMARLVLDAGSELSGKYLR